MGKYRILRHRAKTIDDIGEAARLVLLGAQRNRKQPDEVKVQSFIRGVKEAKAFLLQVMEDEHYGEETESKRAIEAFAIQNLEDCKLFGEKMLAIHKQLKKQAGINRLFYPFFPTSISRMSFTTFELLVFVIVAFVLFFLL